MISEVVATRKGRLGRVNCVGGGTSKPARLHFKMGDAAAIPTANLTQEQRNGLLLELRGTAQTIKEDTCLRRLFLQGSRLIIRKSH